MRKWERAIALVVLFCFVPAVSGDWQTTLRAAAADPAVKQRVELFGVGADVEVLLPSGETLEGAIGDIGVDSFVLLQGRERTSRPVPYDRIAELKFARSTYRASGSPNAAEVRLVALGLGVGEHVAIRVKSGRTYRGNLQAMNESHLVLLPDRQDSAVQIAYADVDRMGPNLSNGAKAGIWAAAVVTAIVVSYKVFSCTRGTDC
jgi:hypothetical protein